VGYTGGRTQSPTYHDLADHTEALQIEFAPEEISWERVLDLFWQGHQPNFESSSLQYRAAIWYADDRQHEFIDTSREKCEREGGGAVKTPILPFEAFWRAEDYHQKYALQRHDRVMSTLREIYPEFERLVDSTVAARLNGFASGRGERALFEAEVESYGIPSDQLHEVVRFRTE
jgi:peptide-methionine (S)-S-oxide reductase